MCHQRKAVIKKMRDHSFLQVVKLLEENDEEQITLADLQEKMLMKIGIRETVWETCSRKRGWGNSISWKKSMKRTCLSDNRMGSSLMYSVEVGILPQTVWGVSLVNICPVALRFLPEFLAKNEPVGSASPQVVVQSLCRTLDR
jgi:hypothetical protein